MNVLVVIKVLVSLSRRENSISSFSGEMQSPRVNDQKGQLAFVMHPANEMERRSETVVRSTRNHFSFDAGTEPAMFKHPRERTW
jgi:hypothetical protein